MKRLFLVFALVAVMFLAGAMKSEAQSGIVYVDLQKVMLDSDKGKQTKQTLTNEANRVKANLDARQTELQKLKDSLEKQAATMTPDTRAAKEREYQTKLKDYQRLANDSQTELQQKEMEHIQRILREVEGVVREMAAKEKYLLILERNQSGVLYGNPAIDITGKVITAYNESVKRPGKR